MLCQAIKDCVLVRLRYEDDAAFRTVAPHAVYYSSKHKVCLSAQQIENPEKPWDRFEPRNFEIAKIVAVEPTTTFTERCSSRSPAPSTGPR